MPPTSSVPAQYMSKGGQRLCSPLPRKFSQPAGWQTQHKFTHLTLFDLGFYFFFTFEIKIGKSGFHTISGRISLDDRYEKVRGIILIQTK